jgi:ABC-2 type transport system permease protein
MVKPKNILSNRREALTRLLLLLAILLLINVVSRLYYFRLDLTAEHRYSISKPTKVVLKNLKDVVTVKVYLDGDLNAGFTRLKESTRNLLNEFRAYGGRNIEFQFIDPTAIQNLDERKAMMTDLIQRGIAPTNLTTKSKTGSKQQLIFPGAIVLYAGREMPVQLLENQIGFGPEEILNNSEIQLEYKFANAIRKLTAVRAPRVAFIHGNGELEEIETADLRQTLASLKYEIKDIDLQNSFNIPETIDAAIIAKPRAAFTEQEKYKIDQYVMHNGKLLWLVDGTDAAMDSLRISPVGQFAVANDLNLDDLLFKYGVRINTDLVQDVNMCNQIPLVVGQLGNAPQTQMFPWYYFPLLISDNNHAIIKNLDPVASYFPSSIDTIKNPGIRKTILLHTSDNSKAQLTPCRVHFGILQSKPVMAYYNQPHIPVAVLLEGEFQSVFTNRLSPETLAAFDTVKSLKFVEKSPVNKMIVISNGNIISNELRSDSTVYPLGYDKFTKQQFANKDFILNCIEYLVDNSGILETRDKDVKLRLLNKVKAEDEKLKWQVINLALPIGTIVLFGFAFNYYRRKKYAA